MTSPWCYYCGELALVGTGVNPLSVQITITDGEGVILDELVVCKKCRYKVKIILGNVFNLQIGG